MIASPDANSGKINMEHRDSLTERVSNGRVLVFREGREEEKPNGICYAPATISLIASPLPGDRLSNAGQVDYCVVDTGGEIYIGEAIWRHINNNAGSGMPHPPEVILTHNHIDHYGGLGGIAHKRRVLAPDSSFVTPDNFTMVPPKLYDEPGQVIAGSIHSQAPISLNTSRVQALSTPGHSGQDLSVLYTSGDGKVLMCGDLFWSENDFRNDSEFMGLCVNPEMQKRSRDWVRNTLRPDVIVPGHGPAFAP